MFPLQRQQNMQSVHLKEMYALVAAHFSGNVNEEDRKTHDRLSPHDLANFQAMLQSQQM